MWFTAEITKPLYFDEARKLTGRPTPFVLDVVKKGLSTTQATVVLMTPDDIGCLRRPFRGNSEPTHETRFTARTRQNVLFEAGMAMALRPDKTVLVELGNPHTISDLAGLHFIRMDNSIEQRKMLADSLETAGCRVDRSGDEWKNKGKGGDFDVAIRASKLYSAEMKELLQDEVRHLEERKPKRIQEDHRLVGEHAEPVREWRTLSRAAFGDALKILAGHAVRSGLGRIQTLEVEPHERPSGTTLFEGRALIRGKRYVFRLLATADGTVEILSFRPER